MNPNVIKIKAVAGRKKLIAQLVSLANDAGLTQKEIALRTGILQPTVSASMSGDNNITVDRLLQICEAAGLEVFIFNPLAVLE